MPARLPGEADRREGDGHRADLRRLDAGEFQAELCRLVRHTVFGVLVAHEALFFGRCNQLAVNVERGRWIMAQCAG